MSKKMMRVLAYEDAKVLCEQNGKKCGNKPIYSQIIEVVDTVNGKMISGKRNNGVISLYYPFELVPIGVNLGGIYERDDESSVL